MVARAGEHHDGCQVIATRLPEACADYFGCNHEGGPLDDETHPIWEWAVEAAEEYEGRKSASAGGQGEVLQLFDFMDEHDLEPEQMRESDNFGWYPHAAER